MFDRRPPHLVTVNFSYETGPEAAATRARFSEERVVFQGEGFEVTIGTDGPTFCVCSDSGTEIGMFGDDDVTESDRRRTLTVHRFATAAGRDEFISERPWQEVAQRRGWAARRPWKRRPGPEGDFSFELHAPLSNSGVRVDVNPAPDGEGACVRSAVSLEGEPPEESTIEVPTSEWARFREELDLLQVERWRQYGANAVDGLSWSVRHVRGAQTHEASGTNSYPPRGDGPEISAEFGRLLLAVERLVGRELGGGVAVPEALATIPDARDRAEHALLAALRRWKADHERRRADPRAMTEGCFEKRLLPFLERLTPARRQVDVNGTMAGWPRVGAVDISLESAGPPIWLELKWAKSAAVLHNCLWDAAKVAQAQRDGAAAHGYLIAGAPVTEWNRQVSPGSLFDVSAWLDESIVGNHQSWWTGWFNENQGTYPLRLPTPLLTVPVGTVHCGSDGADPWVVKVARVETPGVESFVPVPRG